MSKKLLALAISSVIVFSFTGCSQNVEGLEPTIEQEDKFTVGYVSSNLGDVYESEMEEVLKDAVENKGYNALKTVNSFNQPEKQPEIVEDLINEGVNALIVSLLDISYAKTITELSLEAGVPLIYVNQNPYYDNDAIPKGVYFVGPDEYAIGQTQAEFVIEMLSGRGGVIILDDTLTGENDSWQIRGIEETLNTYYPYINVLSRENLEGKINTGEQITKRLLDKYGDSIDAIIATDDQIIIGAFNAVSQENRLDIVLVGTNGTSDALSIINDGHIDASVFKGVEYVGKTAVDEIANHLAGSNNPNIIDTEYVLVTSENVADYN